MPQNVWFMHWHRRHGPPTEHVTASSVEQAVNDFFADPDNIALFASDGQPLLRTSPIPRDGIILWASRIPTTQDNVD
jgi:hypothetical protein